MQEWWETLVHTNYNIRVSVHVFHLADHYSSVWMLYGTPSRNTDKARQGYFRYLRGNGEFDADFQTREVSGMRIGYDLSGRFVRDIIIPVSKLVGDTPDYILRRGNFNLGVVADFDRYYNGDDSGVRTTLR